MTNQFRVLVSDSMSDVGLAALRAAPNVEVDQQTGLSPERLLAIIPDYDALLVRSATRVTAEVLRAGTRLRVVGRAGVGVDNIDVEAATQAGVIVVNAPTGNVVAAAEHTIAMLMALARNIPQADAHVRAGLWKRDKFMGVEVRGKLLGTVGLGRVAQEVVRRAQGLGMSVMAYDPYVTADYASQRGVELVDLDTLVARADFLTLHVPLTPQTRHLINRERLALMQPTARLINVARGGIVDEQALLEAVQAGRLAGAALDVYEHEPLEADSPLRGCPNIILSPHLGGSTVEAQEKVAEDVALQVLDVLNDRPARYAVNAPIIPPKDLEFLVPYIDLAERMGRFMKQLGAQGMGDVELTAEGDLAEFDLTFIRAAVIKGMLADVVSVRINLVNAGLMAEKRGMNLIERKKHQREFAYENLLTLRSTSGAQRWTVRGAILQGEPHIVAINDLWVDFPATGHVLLAMHNDRPGMIGAVGTVLGNADVNISFMHVGRRAPRSEAIMALGTDEPTTPQLQATISAMPHIQWLKAITL
ncbi:MAG TPA: phosphoglycerate dehydrogenase [Chloroflexi bacterium]|nr:phosphoglycerate dehydrogenase [Chloroflexota bacterium]HHW84972.1 phosphoglycerate dehydrogenase [Chloroflexota bacterium]